jgi:Mn2+/Fe2+ NRAMP family transporter
VLGVGLNFTALDPIKALVGSAIVNGVIAVPIMAVLIRLASRREVMGHCVASAKARYTGWAATLVMAIVVIGMAVSSFVGTGS